MHFYVKSISLFLFVGTSNLTQLNTSPWPTTGTSPVQNQSTNNWSNFGTNSGLSSSSNLKMGSSVTTTHSSSSNHPGASPIDPFGAAPAANIQNSGKTIVYSWFRTSPYVHLYFFSKILFMQYCNPCYYARSRPSLYL